MPSVRVLRFVLAACTSAALLATPFSAAAWQRKPAMPRAERHEIRVEIDQLEEQWLDDVLHRKVQALSSLLAEDYTAITANGMLQSKEQTLRALSSGSVRFKSIQVSDRKIRFYGHTALVTSKALVDGVSPEGNISGAYRYTRVYVRDSHGAWKIVSFEVSPIRAPGSHR